jgi:hypothetical protein
MSGGAVEPDVFILRAGEPAREWPKGLRRRFIDAVAILSAQNEAVASGLMTTEQVSLYEWRVEPSCQHCDRAVRSVQGVTRHLNDDGAPGARSCRAASRARHRDAATGKETFVWDERLPRGLRATLPDSNS